VAECNQGNAWVGFVNQLAVTRADKLVEPAARHTMDTAKQEDVLSGKRPISAE
jgi:hypothetical protein